ncbi:MAG: glycosyltransferase family 2 protein [Gemmatimonadota bacterium]|nr:glycosyltransferase family 2 protein [Gemmatimonadota bacterium]
MMADSERPLLSLVVPFYNEELVIDEFHARIVPVLEGTKESFEVICVNDGSRDKTAVMLDALAASDPRFKAAHFSRNFGHQAAVTAGVHLASGKCAIIIDADLQDPPELIDALLAKWREGFDIVYAQRRARAGEGRMKRGTAFLFYRILGRITEAEIPVDTGDFCLLDRKVIDVMNAMPEHNRYLRGLRAWVGFRQAAVEFDRRERYAGESKYRLRRMVRLALDGVFSLSWAPLRMAIWLGLFSAATSLLLAVVLLVEKIAGTYEGAGWASMVVIVLFLGGVQLVCIGAVGEYIGLIYDEVKQRPLYIIARTSGL